MFAKVVAMDKITYESFIGRYGACGTYPVPASDVTSVFATDHHRLPSWMAKCNPHRLRHTELESPKIPSSTTDAESSAICLRALRSVYTHFGMCPNKKHLNLYPSERSKNLKVQAVIFRDQGVAPARWYYSIFKKTIESAAYKTTNSADKLKFRLQLLYKSLLSATLLENKSKRMYMRLYGSQLKGGQVLPRPDELVQLSTRFNNIHTIAKRWFMVKGDTHMTSKHVAAFVWLDRYGPTKDPQLDPITLYTSEYLKGAEKYTKEYELHKYVVQNFEISYGEPS